MTEPMNLAIQEPKKKTKGRGDPVHAELPPELSHAFKTECKRQGVDIKGVLLFLISGWLAKKNPAEAKRLGLLK